MLDILNCNVCKRNITDTGRLYGGLCVNCLEAENKAKDARIKVLEAEVESHEKVVEYQAKRVTILRLALRACKYHANEKNESDKIVSIVEQALNPKIESDGE